MVRPSKVLVAIAAGFLVGVAFSSLLPGTLWSLLSAVLIAGVLTLIIGGSRDVPEAVYAGVFLLSLFSGVVRATFPSVATASPELFYPLREMLAERAGTIIGGAEHAAFAAMVFGWREALTPALTDAFSRAGVRHILAISGMHLTIVAVLLMKVSIGIGMRRTYAFYSALAGIGAFVLLVGVPPSAVRAGIMAGLYLWALHIGRAAQAWRLVLAAAAVMVLIQPHLLLFSVSFQLSFLAVLGIIFFKPFFDTVFSAIPFESVRDLMSLSVAAQLTTWPIVGYTFETVSLVGPIANLLVVPLLPLIMMLGMGYLVFGWWHVAALVVLWPAWVVLRGVVWVVSGLAVWEFAAVEVGFLSITLMAAYYLLLIAGYRLLRRRIYT